MKSPNNPTDEPQDSREEPYWWENPAHPGPDWRGLLTEGTTREVLHRLIEGDPLDLYPLCEAMIGEAAMMLEPERIFLRASAQIASSVKHYGEEDPFFEWLQDTIGQGIEDLLEEDRQAEQIGLEIDPENRQGYRDMIPHETGIEDGRTRLATIVFNELTEPERRPFFHVVVEGLSVEEYAEFEGLSIDLVVQSIAQTTQAIVRGCDPFDRDPFDNGGTLDADNTPDPS